MSNFLARPKRASALAVALLPALGAGSIWVAAGDLARAETRWIDGRGQSCWNVCTAQNMSPVGSGTYRNGNVFYVCSANAQGEGPRPGFNLEPNWANACWVGWGGKELAVQIGRAHV